MCFYSWSKTEIPFELSVNKKLRWILERLLESFSMTFPQIEQWNKYACLARCLLRSAPTTGASLTRDEFCSRFEHLFHDRTTRYGQLDAQAFFTVLTPLGFPSSVSESTDLFQVGSAFNRDKKRVLVMSEVDLSPGRTNLINHCSVLTSIDSASSFSVWTPDQDGSDGFLNLTVIDWEAKKCSGLIFG